MAWLKDKLFAHMFYILLKYFNDKMLHKYMIGLDVSYFKRKYCTNKILKLLG